MMGSLIGTLGLLGSVSALPLNSPMLPSYDYISTASGHGACQTTLTGSQSSAADRAG